MLTAGLFWIDTAHEYRLQLMCLFNRWSARAAFSQSSISRVKSGSQEKKETGMTPLQAYLLENYHQPRRDADRLMLTSLVCLFVCLCDCNIDREREICALDNVCSNLIMLFLHVCFMLICKAEEKDTVYSLSSHTTALHPFLCLLLFHEIFTLSAEAASSLVFSQTQSDVCSCLSLGLQSCSHLYLALGRTDKPGLALQSSSVLICHFFSFLCDALDMNLSFCLLCVLFWNCLWCWKVMDWENWKKCLSVCLFLWENWQTVLFLLRLLVCHEV